MAKAETCEKHNCTLEANHEGWHVKKAARGKIVISWLNGQWKSPDGQHGTYRYQDPPGHGYLNSEPMFDSDPRLKGGDYSGGEV